MTSLGTPCCVNALSTSGFGPRRYRQSNLHGRGRIEGQEVLCCARKVTHLERQKKEQKTNPQSNGRTPGDRTWQTMIDQFQMPLAQLHVHLLMATQLQRLRPAAVVETVPGVLELALGASDES